MNYIIHLVLTSILALVLGFNIVPPQTIHYIEDHHVKAEDWVHFYFYNSPHGFQQVFPKKLLVEFWPGFNPNYTTYFLTHGLHESKDSKSMKNLLGAIFKKNGFKTNVFVADWSAAAKWPYMRAAQRLKTFARYAEFMVRFCIRWYGDPDDMTMVGIGLGAHLMGLTGNFSKVKVGHLIALDPEGAGYEAAPPTDGVSTHSAKVVEVIHTGGGNYKLRRPAGTHDFYPNGGMYQIGCHDDHCDHERAVDIYVEALAANNFVARSCENWEKFASGNCDHNPTEYYSHVTNKTMHPGVYYFVTKSSRPFGLSLKGAEHASVVAQPSRGTTFATVTTTTHKPTTTTHKPTTTTHKPVTHKPTTHPPTHAPTITTHKAPTTHPSTTTAAPAATTAAPVATTIPPAATTHAATTSTKATTKRT